MVSPSRGRTSYDRELDKLIRDLAERERLRKQRKNVRTWSERAANPKLTDLREDNFWWNEANKWCLSNVYILWYGFLNFLKDHKDQKKIIPLKVIDT